MLRFRCPSGHKLRARKELQGKKVVCPRCRQAFVLPRAGVQMPLTRKRDPQAPTATRVAEEVKPDAVLPAGLPSGDTVSESGAFQLLDMLDQRQLPPTQIRPPRKNCPRCQQLVEAAARICPGCHLYLGISDRQWDRSLNLAVREVLDNPLRRRAV